MPTAKSYCFPLPTVLGALPPHLSTFSSLNKCLHHRSLLDHGIVVGRGQSRDANKRLGLVLTLGRATVGHRGEGEVIMFQNGEAVEWLLLLQVEHFPELLQLLQLTEGLQHHQHDYETQDQVD